MDQKSIGTAVAKCVAMKSSPALSPVLQELRSLDPSRLLEEFSEELNALFLDAPENEAALMHRFSLLFRIANSKAEWSRSVWVPATYREDFLTNDVLEFEVHWSAEQLAENGLETPCVERGEYEKAKPWRAALIAYFERNTTAFTAGFRGALPAPVVKKILAATVKHTQSIFGLRGEERLARTLYQATSGSFGTYCCGFGGVAIAFPAGGQFFGFGRFC